MGSLVMGSPPFVERGGTESTTKDKRPGSGTVSPSKRGCTDAADGTANGRPRGRMVSSLRAIPTGRAGRRPGGFGGSRPAQPLQDGAAHHPVLVALGEERQLLGEVGDALLVGGAVEAVGHVGAPIAALRPEGLEQPLDVRGEILERIG